MSHHVDLNKLTVNLAKITKFYTSFYVYLIFLQIVKSHEKRLSFSLHMSKSLASNENAPSVAIFEKLEQFDHF